MSLYFCNFYPSRTWVAIMWYAPFCENKFGNYWTRQGWFSLDPLACKKVLPNAAFPDVGDDLSDVNRYFCYFAIANDGATWSGPYKRRVTNSKFHRYDCLSYSDGWIAGFKLFDVDGNDDYTINLIP